MKIPLKETFSKQALALERQLWQANPTDQKTLLALQSGNVSGVNVPGGTALEKAAKEKEEKETTYNLMLEVMEAASERFRQTFEDVKYRIAENREYFQKKLDDLDQDEVAFKKDTILLQQGLEVYPDANDPRRYFYQDESGGWHELQDETYLEQARDIHRQKGAVHTMQNKQNLDRYKDELHEDVKTLDQIEADSEELNRQVQAGKIHPEKATKKVKEFEERIAKVQAEHEEFPEPSLGEKAEFVEPEKILLRNEFRQSVDQKSAQLASDNDLLDNSYEPTVAVPEQQPAPTPFKKDLF